MGNHSTINRALWEVAESNEGDLAVNNKNSTVGKAQTNPANCPKMDKD